MQLCRGKQSRVGGWLLLSYCNQFISLWPHAETSLHPWWRVRESISLHPSRNRFCYSSMWGNTSLQQSSWKPPPTCALWTWSQPKHLCPKPGSLEGVYMSCHPGTSSPLALTEAVLIRRLFANTVPPEYWRILILLKDSNAAQRILQQTAHCMQDTVSGGVICRFVMWTRDYM